jgi:hypothetical protein
MGVFSYHLLEVSYFTAVKMLLFPPKIKNSLGLVHLECMSAMELGAPLLSTKRVIVRQIAVFAQWESEDALDLFLKHHPFGQKLKTGWYLKLGFLRQWGRIRGYRVPKQAELELMENSKVVAVTLARMRILEIPRFLKWGRPVEKLVRDHPGALLSLASIRFPRTVSTFSVWNSVEEMEAMVHGHSAVPRPKRHAHAMLERDRKNFHFEFTTLRFVPISEHGAWKGRRGILNDIKE